MKALFSILAGVVLGVLLLFVGAAIAGTICWLLWPLVIPVVFPALVAKGILAARIPWLIAVFFVWLVGLFGFSGKSGGVSYRSKSSSD